MMQPRYELGTSRRSLVRTMRSGALRALVIPASSFVVLPLVLDRLGTQRFGVWATLSSLLAVGGLVDVGIRAEIIRRVARAHGADDLAAGIRAAREGVTILAVGCVAAFLVVAVLSWPIVSFAFPDLNGSVRQEAHGVLLGLAVVLVVSVVNGGMFAVTSGLARTDVENVTTLCAGLVGAAATVLLVRGADLGLWGMLGGAAANVAVLVGGQLWSTKQIANGLRWPFVRLSRRIVRGYVAVSGLLFLSQIGDVIDFQYDKVVLSKYLAPGAAGQYQLGSMLSLNLRLLALIPMTALLAGTAELSTRSSARARRLLDAATAFTYAAGGLLMTGIVVFAPSFMLLWLGRGFEQAATAAQLLAVAMAMNLVGAPWTSYAIGRGWVRIPAASAVGNMVTNATVSLALVRAIGFNGALYGSIAGNVIGLLVFYFLLRRRARETCLRPMLRPALACALVGAVAFELVSRADPLRTSWLAFLLGVTLFTVVLGALLALVTPARLRAEALAALPLRRSSGGR